MICFILFEFVEICGNIVLFSQVTGRCVNKPDQTEPVGCYKNSLTPLKRTHL